MEWLNENHDDSFNSLIVLDNLGFKTDKSKFLTELFQHARHKNCSIINIIHEVFSNKQLKAQRGLCDYFHCFYLFGHDIENLIQDIFGRTKDKYAKGMGMYDESQQKPYGHLVLDLSARPADKERYAKRYRINKFFEQ